MLIVWIQLIIEDTIMFIEFIRRTLMYRIKIKSLGLLLAWKYPFYSVKLQYNIMHISQAMEISLSYNETNQTRT